MNRESGTDRTNGGLDGACAQAAMLQSLIMWCTHQELNLKPAGPQAKPLAKSLMFTRGLSRISKQSQACGFVRFSRDGESMV
jgi:hypothetical protein